ncbi:MAG: SAM-dependent methyltransferase [Opitutaceae bacterium]|jgi:tRNA (guanine-N7-)-methyltransferase
MASEIISTARDTSPKPEYLALMAKRRKALQDELAAIMPRNAKFVWEIGSGHGHFLTAYAEAHKDQLCVGVDIIIERVRRGDKKRDRAELKNLHFVRAEARLFLDVLPDDARFASIYVLFPDPWPKKRHHKNRIMQADFLHRVAMRAEIGAPLYFRTDYAPYFSEVEEMLRNHPDWQLRKDNTLPFELATVFQIKAPSYQSLVAVRRQVAR